MRWIAVLAGIAMLGGCFKSELEQCRNGAYCPAGLTCTERTPTVCGDPESVAVCDGMADRVACSSPKFPVGTCASGVCSECSPELVECRYPDWQPMASQTTEDLLALAVLAANDVYAVGGTGAIVHYDGTAWSAVAGPGTTERLIRVWASNTDDLYVVSQGGTLFHRGSGGSWQSKSFAPHEARAVWGSSADRVFVTSQDTSGGTPASFVEKFDGSAWSVMPANTIYSLQDIWGRGASEAFAVGTGGVIQQLIDDGNWQASNTPSASNTFVGVWVSATGRAVAVGTQTSTVVTGLIAMKEGGAWNISTAASKLTDVWGFADDDVYAVGEAYTEGSNIGFVLHRSGGTWTRMPAIPTDKNLRGIQGVETDGKQDLFAVGDGGTILRLSP